MAKFEVEFFQSSRGTILVEADSHEEAEAEVQYEVEDWGEEYLNQYIERSEFILTTTVVGEDEDDE